MNENTVWYLTDSGHVRYENFRFRKKSRFLCVKIFNILLGFFFLDFFSFFFYISLWADLGQPSLSAKVL